MVTDPASEMLVDPTMYPAALSPSPQPHPSVPSGSASSGQLWLALPLPCQWAQWDTAPLGNLEDDLWLGDSWEEVEVEAEVEVKAGVVAVREAFLQEDNQQEASRPKHWPSMAQFLIFLMGIATTSHASATPSQSTRR
jgi:hypothetical protein